MSQPNLLLSSGGRIWCEIVSDVDVGTELRANFIFDLDDLSPSDREIPMLLAPTLNPEGGQGQSATSSSGSASPPNQPSSSTGVQPGHGEYFTNVFTRPYILYGESIIFSLCVCV